MIQYTQLLKSNLGNDEYGQVFKEAVNYTHQSCHVNPLRDAAALYSDASAFRKYIDKLTEGFAPQDAENLRALLENNQMQVLSEASLGGIPPITALNCPTIVKMWAKSGLKNVIPTQVVDKPVFSVLFSKPYMLDSKGEKVYLPEGLVNEKTKNVGNKEKMTLKIEAKNNGKVVDLKTLDTTGRLAQEEVDYVKIVKVGEVVCNQKQSLERRFYVELADNVVLGQCDMEKRTILLMQTNSTPVDIEIEVGVSSAQHTRSTEISFEVSKRDFEIPTGEHFEANMPLEFINDMYALYQIDSAAMATETMSNVINQKLEQSIDEFLSEYIDENVQYHRSFNIKPMVHYSIQPKDWVEELKRVIDYLANVMKTKSYFYQGYFVIYGNPVDIALLPNVSWTFNSASDNVNGIAVNYALGAMSGTNKYVIVSSDLVEQGALKMIMVPTVQDYKTFMYYPYTFNIVNNYLNAQGRKTMPNLMMTKRQTFGEFMNLSAKITIVGNDGRLGYNEYNTHEPNVKPGGSGTEGGDNNPGGSGTEGGEGTERP